jgi:hypothetical protein
MITTASVLVFASAAIVFVLGTLHLIYTFAGTKLHPRDPALRTHMESVSPVITRETTMWKTWVGFNASHSYGAILFGAFYGYLALVHTALLFHSAYLAGLGGVALVAYDFLAIKYWFSIPRRGVILATTLYAAGFVLALV